MTRPSPRHAAVSNSATTDTTPAQSADRLRVATYNIHKGVRGMGLAKRLEIHNLSQGVRALDADLVFLQEVRLFHHREARHFERSYFGWPEQGQAEFLAPDGYEVAYRTNAITRHGEHGNALLSRYPIGDIGHHDVSDHRFEQRGLLHVPVHWQGVQVHAVVAHLGLMHGSRVRQVQRLQQFINDHVPGDAPLVVAGDFNDWGERLDEPIRVCGLSRAVPHGKSRGLPTFPSRVPVFSLDRIYMRGLRCVDMKVPRGPAWARMSDHLPLLAELVLDA
ncbi:endonuclease/exonuclease/phosphatase family protein [Roseateles amylovorans]|uniref:Endonuclease/exonuclease/phosphatase family protein n=1 Tax=Roseateles amylovorans TaxID=2978473 RepID=A0ABY6B2C7_9BURK|nr:endonuclease/exonuclease/phosphatase family protein [Roseateles amylovorans]UXH79546.1 endonuclease/exonuclease/phosphatase family protein [Roseateles amylovorans]